MQSQARYARGAGAAVREFVRHATPLAVVLLVFAPFIAEAHSANTVSSSSVGKAQAMTQSVIDLASKYQAARGPQRAQLETQLVAAASTRQAFLTSIMEDEPDAVMEATLPAAVRSRLPASVLAYLEQSADLTGKVTILHEDRSDGGRYHYLLDTARGRVALHFVGRSPDHWLTGATVRVHGVQIGTMLALGDAITSTQQLGPAPLPITLGAQRTAVILVNFADNPVQPYSSSDAESAIFGTTSQFIQENSYGQSSLVGDVFGWFTVPLASTTCDYASIASYAQSAAVAAGADLSRYAHQVYAFPQNACGWWGLSSVGGTPSQSWINGSFELAVLAHELGHGQGLWHAHSLDCGSTVIIGPTCTTNEYGDIIDIMGASHWAHYNAFEKERLGWLNYGISPSITTVSSNGTYTIAPYETQASAPKALKILKSTDPSTGQRTWYYVEFRQPLGFDAFLTDPSVGSQNVTSGVLVHTGSESGGNTSFLLDMSPATPVYYWWYDPALVAGQTFTDPDAGLTITTAWVAPDGAGVTVKLGSQSSAISPSVAVSTNQSTYARGQTVYVTAKVAKAGSPVAKASVSFLVVKANGSKVTGNATTGSDGTAVYKLRLAKQDPTGVYQADASASSGGQSTMAATNFTVN